MSPCGTPTAEAARTLEVLLDLLGCLACPPTGYLLDPAYRGMLDPGEAAVAEALAQTDRDVTDDARSTRARSQVRVLLRRLGQR